MRLEGHDRLQAAAKEADGVFVARERAKTELCELLSQQNGVNQSGASLVLLTGPGGIGKSALARKIADDRLRHKAWATAYYIDAGGCRTAEDLALRMCHAFQVGHPAAGGVGDDPFSPRGQGGAAECLCFRFRL